LEETFNVFQNSAVSQSFWQVLYTTWTDKEQNMTEVTSPLERPSPKTILIAVLLVAIFAAAIIDNVVPITMVDIAKTFGIKVGEAAKLGVYGSFARVATALLLGYIGLRHRYKSLVIAGVVLVAVCETGLFLAPTFQIAQLIYPLNAIGSVLIVVTAETFVGNFYPLNRKAKAIGWIVATGYIAGAVGAPAVGFLSGMGGWRSVIPWFMLPIAISSLLFVLLAFPSNPPEIESNARKEPFMKGIKQVLTNKSVLALFAAGFLGSGAVATSAVFAVTFYRQVFSVDTGFASLIGSLAMTSLLALGSVAGGHLVNRVGRKRQSLVAGFFAYLFIAPSYFVPDLWTCLILRWIGAVFGGIATVASVNLLLEQVPKFRGTAISLGAAFSGIGVAVSIFVGGIVLDYFSTPTLGFQALGLMIGILGLSSIPIVLFFTKEPIKNHL
jgi:predicted MFS family arabinose efflux permease